MNSANMNLVLVILKCNTYQNFYFILDKAKDTKKVVKVKSEATIKSTPDNNDETR